MARREIFFLKKKRMDRRNELIDRPVCIRMRNRRSDIDKLWREFI